MRFIYIFIFVLTILLFVGGPDYESHRVIKNIWDMGHVFLFAIVSYSALNLGVLKKYSNLNTFLLIIFLSFSSGLVIEVLQSYVGRNFEFEDVFSDIAGAVIGYLIYQLTTTNILGKAKILVSAILIILIGGSSLPLIKVLMDEYNMREEFPNLANFESPFQLNRWDTHLTTLSFNTDFVSKGKYSLEATFYPGEYSDITLQHFVRDWSDYKKLQFELYNSGKKPVLIELKIYDNAHINNSYAYDDRFNKKISLQPGWNKVLISLGEIISSPKNRDLDITKVKSFSLFLSDLSKPKILYLDNIQLKK